LSVALKGEAWAGSWVDLLGAHLVEMKVKTKEWSLVSKKERTSDLKCTPSFQYVVQNHDLHYKKCTKFALV